MTHPASERLDRRPHLVTRPAQIMRRLVLVTIFGHSKLTKHQRHLRHREPPAEESCRVIISASLPDEDEEPHPAYVSSSPIACNRPPQTWVGRGQGILVDKHQEDHSGESQTTHIFLVSSEDFRLAKKAPTRGDGLIRGIIGILTNITAFSSKVPVFEFRGSFELLDYYLFNKAFR